MAYRTILSSETAPNAPLTSQLAIAFSDNLLASFAAESGAPRLALGALPRLVAGSDVRFEDTSTHTVTTNTTEIAHSVGIFQGGEIRVSFDNRVTAGSTSIAFVVRTRAGSSTTLATNTANSGSWDSTSADITVLPGDLITFQHTLTGTPSPPSGSEIRNCRISTDAVDLYPGGLSFGYITGNDALT